MYFYLNKSSEVKKIYKQFLETFKKKVIISDFFN